MQKAKTSKFKSTTFAAVTLDTLKQTPVWKQYSDEKGNVSPSKFENVLKAAMYSLGYDIDGENKYSKRVGEYVVRSSKDKTKGVVTEIYDFPIKDGHKFEMFFLTNSFVHVDSEHSTEFVDLAEHGLEYYEMTPRKSDKREKEENVNTQAIEISDSFVRNV